MSLSSIVNRLSQMYPDFTYRGAYSILSSMIAQISYEIDSVFQQVSANNKTDLFLQSGTDLDDLAALVGITRRTIVGVDQNAIVPEAVSIMVKDLSKSILTVLQELYGTQDKFPKTFYITDGKNTLEVLQNFDTSDQLDVHQLTLPIRFISFAADISANTQMEITGDHQQLADYLTVKTTQLSLYQYVESDASLRARISSVLQNYIGPTSQWLQAYILGNFPNVRYVLIKNFQRGLQTADVVLFPTLQAIYDENKSLIIDSTLAQTVESAIQTMLPLGIDVLIKNAEQIKLSAEIVFTDVPDDYKSQIVEDQKTQMINTLFSYEIGVRSTISVQQIKSDFNKQIASVKYPYTISSFKLYINSVEQTQIEIQDTQYLVLNDISVTQ